MTAGREEIKGAVIFTVRKYYMTHVDLLYIDVCRFRISPYQRTWYRMTVLAREVDPL